MDTPWKKKVWSEQGVMESAKEQEYNHRCADGEHIIATRGRALQWVIQKQGEDEKRREGK